MKTGLASITRGVLGMTGARNVTIIAGCAASRLELLVVKTVISIVLPSQEADDEPLFLAFVRSVSTSGGLCLSPHAPFAFRKRLGTDSVALSHFAVNLVNDSTKGHL